MTEQDKMEAAVAKVLGRSTEPELARFFIGGKSTVQEDMYSLGGSVHVASGLPFPIEVSIRRANNE